MILKKTTPLACSLIALLILNACVETKVEITASSSNTQNGTAETFSEFIWPDLAPGESSASEGEAQPPREGEDPPVTRLVNIRKPGMDIFLPEKPNGVGVVIVPGGGFAKVVPDKEGSEAAEWLNTLGITAVVLRHRTSEGKPEDEAAWLRPLQDLERATRIVRSRAGEWKLDPEKIGVLGFSAGGQVSSIFMTETGDETRYEPIDEVDKESFLPNFGLLIYPWKIIESKGDRILQDIRVTKETPPAFIVHTHDDASSSVGSALLYISLKNNKVPAELHIYQNGGHGYGMRPVANSDIASWTERATDWLKRRSLAK